MASAAPAKRSTKRVIPKNLAAAADLLYAIREERLAAQKALEPLVSFESQLRQHIIDTLPKSQAGGIAGKVVRVEIVKDVVPTIGDKKKLLAFVKKSGDFDLITSSLNTKAARERWDAGKTIPGVDKFTVVKLSMNKLKGGK